MTELSLVPTTHKTIRDQIARHPLLAFITIAYAISWLAWFIMNRIDLGGLNGFNMIGAMGPALAAMIISAFLNPEPSGVSAEKRWKLPGLISIGLLSLLFLRRLWLTTELTTIAGRVMTNQVYPSFAVFLLDFLAVAAAASILSAFQSPRHGVSNLLHSLDLRQNQPGWYWFVIVIGLYPVIVMLGNAISTGLGLPVPVSKASGPWYFLALDVLLVYFVTLFGGGGLEEPGWRGFALPILLKRYSPLISSIILAVIWAFWHWPMFWFGYYGGGPLGVLFFIIGCIPNAILFTAIFHLTKSSLPIVILLHTSINVTPIFLPTTMIASGLWWLLILCVAIGMWRSSQIFSYRPINRVKQDE